MKHAMLALLIVLFVFPAAVSAKTTIKTSCDATQFKIVLKTTTDLKESASTDSKTVETYRKNKELSVIGKTRNWYKVCHSNHTGFIAMKNAREVFSSGEKTILKKLDKRKDISQLVAATGKTMGGMKVTIRTYEKKKGEWRRALGDMKGVTGKNGFTKNKKEGDGKAPVGMYSFGTAFGSTSKPDKVKMDYRKTTKYDYWIDDPASKDYNKWVTYKGKNPYEKWKSFERMNHELYKYGAVINYNRNPIIKGKGSAIFLHIWRGENKPTAGCTATSEKNVLSLLKWMDPEKNPHIIMGTYDSLNSVK
ncbi:L,D-transpeptidase family protein [Peribacillus sp. NPDC097206]|uniref:L,D-transpeptidase family protein n=2 Tax=Peribacillus TaxID=2675229 RepID=UPI00381733BC